MLSLPKFVIHSTWYVDCCWRSKKHYITIQFDSVNHFLVATCRQFHQRYEHKNFVRKSFWQLFSSYMYIEKAAKMMFVWKICAHYIDEIDIWEHFFQIIFPNFTLLLCLIWFLAWQVKMLLNLIQFFLELFKHRW